MVFVLSCFIAVVACDKNGPSTPIMQPPAGIETITGTERLGWEQRAADAAELAQINYVLYVDGIRTPLPGTTCEPSGSAFACVTRLPAMAPGAHALQLASFINDGGVLESGRSGTLNVTVVSAATGQAGETAAAVKPARFTSASGVAMRTEPVASGLDDPTDLVFAPDGRAFVAERGGRVRVMRDNVLLPDPALSLADMIMPGTTLLALAVDADFDRTGFVFAIYVLPARAGNPTFTLARFRETSNTLADRIVLLGDVQASASPAATLRFGADKKLYAAFDDGGDPRLRADAASLNGKLLRLNADGTTSADQRRMSPVQAEGIAAPKGFDWDSKTGRPSAVLAASSAPYRGRLFPAFTGSLLMASLEGRLVARSQAGSNETLAADRIAGATVVAVSPEGAIYFATANAIGRVVPDTAAP
jgi:glucose/arabinose dehydrogenase